MVDAAVDVTLTAKTAFNGVNGSKSGASNTQGGEEIADYIREEGQMPDQVGHDVESLDEISVQVKGFYRPQA